MPEAADLTELTAMDADELHLVGGGANGFPQLLAKSLGAEVDEELAKATWSTAQVNDFPDSSFAFIEKGGKKDADGKTTPRSLRHFPIRDADGKADAPHVRNALARAGQSPFGDKAMPRIKAAAKEAGVELSKEAAMVKCPTCKGKKTVPQDDGTDEQCPMCKGAGQITEAAATTLSKDDGTVVDQTDATIPGSQAWETQDAEALIEAGQMLANAATMLNNSANRERIEVATGHADDMGDVNDLSDAVYAVQSALSIVARVAFTEEAEAQAAGAMAKSLRSPETADAIRKVVGELSLLAKATDPGGAAVGSQKGATMALDITTDELGALIKSGVEEALPAAVDAALLAKAEADKAAEPTAEEKAAAEKLAKDTADLAPLVGLAPEVLAGLEEMAKSAAGAVPDPNEALIKSIVDANRAAITEEVAPLTAKIDAQDLKIEELSKAARPGGPRVSVPGIGRSGDAAGGEVDITELQERFEKALPGSVEKADLGERLTKMRLLNEYGVPVKTAATS